MSTTGKTDLHREQVRATLEQRMGGAPDASLVADATVNLWRDVAARLTPIIGTGGVDAIFGRALHLSGIQLPSHLMPRETEASHAALACLGRHLESHDAATGAEASVSLFVNFSELLVTLIGEPLTDRLLSPVWAPKPSGSEEETAS